MIKAILARFFNPDLVEKKLSKLLVKYVHPKYLQKAFAEATQAFAQ